MSLREWLIAIGTLLIIGIVLDGLRRMRRARKESMAISSGMGADDLEDSPLDDEYNPELPNGGARTISRDTLEERGYVKREKSSRFAAPKPKPTRPVTASAGKTPEARPAPEPAPESSDPHNDDVPDYPLSSLEPDDAELESGWSAYETADESGSDSRDEKAPEPQPEPELVPPTVTTEVEEDTARREPSRRETGQPLAGANRPEAREVVVINVLAKKGEEFQGPALKKLFEACGLEHGDMDIYHRHEQADTTSPVQFSVANAVEPGTFKP
ncbi:MAG: cell division protein ZipA C-terminal FtsZ-binding domain-containing protein, partial [Pseudomonadota bacterium]|nr:cell division protein ZipA C-terminal FtsZ-binding domain-containing protein [Pseudomonadota bacterium]